MKQQFSLSALTAALAFTAIPASAESLSLPYFESFASAAALDACTIIDANGDGCSWAFYASNSSASCQTNDAAYAASDDWLLTPEIFIPATNKVNFSCLAFGQSSYYREKMSVWYGQGTDPSTYTELIPETNIECTRYTNTLTLSAVFQVPADGDYHIAFHATSDANAWRVCVADVSLTQGTLLTAPDIVTNLAVTPDNQGQQRATISFNAPTQRANGQDLAELTHIEVYRGTDLLVKTIYNPVAGNAYEVEDTDMPVGNITYTVYAYNTEGKSDAATSTAFVGPDVPAAPADVMVRDQFNGTALLTWSAPTEGVNDGYINPADLRYNIYAPGAYSWSDDQLIASGVEGESYAIELSQQGPQSILSYIVKAQSAAGEGAGTRSNDVYAGASYGLPFVESFANGKYAHDLWTNTTNGYYYFTFANNQSVDGDGYSLKYNTYAAGNWAAVTSGKINLMGAYNPALMFSLHETVLDASADIEFSVLISNPLTCQETELTHILFSESSSTGWHDYVLPLTDYLDCPYINVTFRALCNNTMTDLYLDAIQVRDVLDYDLSIEATAPKHVEAGQAVDVSVTVHNEGSNNAGQFDICLYDNGTLLAKVSDQNLAAYHSKDYVLQFTPAISAPESLEISAQVEFAYDLEPENDAVVLRFIVGHCDLPHIEDLTLSGNVLSWSEPDLTQDETTEDFESYTAWSISEVGKWKLVDADGGNKTALGHDGRTMPHANTPFAWIVYNPYDFELNLTSYPSFTPHSGEQFMAAFAASYYWLLPNGHNDNWLISPELSGEAQTISFYVNKYLDGYFMNEQYNVLYSTTDQQTESFTQVFTSTVADGQWNKIEVELPAGARYFAIQYVGQSQFAMFIDDITYHRAMPAILGYNIYRNQQLIDTTTDLSYELSEVDAAATYNVTVVYEGAESVFSNAIDYVTGIASVRHSAVEVYTLDGHIVARNMAEYQALSHGLYVIRSTDGSMVKVMK